MIIDIETAPLNPDPSPFEPTEFDASEVKIGNLKDPDKIDFKIQGAEKRHRREQFELAELHAESATLHPLRSYINAIGMMSKDGVYEFVDCDDQGGERELLRSFWMRFLHSGDQYLSGWNSYNFDFPRIAIRCAVHGITPPMPVFTRSGYPAGEWLRDMKLQFLGKGIAKITLDAAAKACGLDGKKDTGEVTLASGRVRKRLPHELRAQDVEAFREYLEADVRMTYELSKRI